MELAKNVYHLITKDTCNPNESKRLVMVIRIEVISVLIYLLVNSFLCGPVFGIQGSLYFLAFIPFFFLVLVLSYRIQTITTFIYYNFMMLGLIYTAIKRFGWNIGIQHFIIVLLVLCFFTGYDHYLLKTCYVVLLSSIRIYLFILFRKGTPLYEITGSEEAAFQIFTTITVFWCVGVVAFVFSKSSQELEGKLIEYNNQLKTQANTDALTGLFNRRRAIEYMENLAGLKSEHEGFSLCICDIDFFKKVNDQYGHDVGDEVLKTISQIFTQQMDGKGMAARWGGEEFLLLFRNCNGDNAYIYLEEISSKIKSRTFQAGDRTFHITMTFGLAEYDYNSGFETTIKEADEKLYLGKESGRDKIVF